MRDMRLYGLSLASIASLFFLNMRWLESVRIADNYDSLNSNFPLRSNISSFTVKVVVVACNRPEGMLRTLDSARNARSVFGRIDLHICVDRCGNDEVEQLARSYVWPHGRKTFTIRESNYGLAKHIVNCWVAPKDGEWALLLEDDVVVSPLAFLAFKEALTIRSGYHDPGRIVGIALHDVRVNQYCWKNQVRWHECPHIHSQCKTKNAKESIFGSLVCQESNVVDHKWVLRQFPSSWGVFYNAKAWSLLQQYSLSRTSVTPGSSLLFSVPHSMSNEWSNSWKRFLLEIMYGAGWTLMYRSHPTQLGFSTTLREAGEHTTSNAKKEAEASCLLSLPLFNSSVFVPDKFLLKNPNGIRSYSYCNELVSGNDLIQRGADLLSSFSRRNRSDPDFFYPSSGHSSVVASANVLRGTHANRTHLSKESSSKDEIVLVTSSGIWSQEFETMIAQLEELETLVTLVVVAPSSVCIRLRGNILTSCLADDSFKEFEEGDGLPRISSLLQAAADVSLPGVTKWTGIMNSDIIFDHSLVRTLSSLYETNTCGGAHNQQSACVVTGQRIDVDWKSKTETIHSVFGMDYFVFNNRGLAFALRDGFIPAFTIGRVRWDSWLMGSFVTSTDIHVIDVSKSARVVHYMNMKDAYARKTKRDTNNLILADEMYRMGRTNFANFGFSLDSNYSLVPMVSAKESRAQLETCRFRWRFDYEVEKATRFIFSPSGLRVLPCFCRVLATLVPSVVNSTEIGKLCSVDLKTLTTCQTGAKRPVTVFKKEVFEMIAKVGKGGLDIQGEERMEDFVSDANSSCCVLENDWELPHSLPGPLTLSEEEVSKLSDNSIKGGKVDVLGANKTDILLVDTVPARCLLHLY